MLGIGTTAFDSLWKNPASKVPHFFVGAKPLFPVDGLKRWATERARDSIADLRLKRRRNVATA